MELMMKNVYSLGSGKLESSNFQLNILYEDDKTGNSINYLPEGNMGNKILLQVLGLDNLNSQLDHESDGYFDFIDGITVNMNRGKIIFPVVEPFGTHLRSRLAIPGKQVCLSELYDSTQTLPGKWEKNKFKMMGQYTSESGSNKAQCHKYTPGVVKVTAECNTYRKYRLYR
jgi:cell surface protein SprA